ncbi:CHAT domain-containing protein [Aerosakkonemataceae cyanobacterium BLCC-F50]|uniref:CHAT domain-containing protein n=1 Tax=Floridaenema flaviceps BLCC-F50 TaxID=3153642 RepID=A0ABV4XIZ5_9CYAN
MNGSKATHSEIAIERVVGFAQQFDRAHLDLACHAAFPQTLTPDLLYQIWLRFIPQAPWTAVARILLSRLCREVGYELYEMDMAVRNLLLEELKEDRRFGKPRLKELAAFYTKYVKQQLDSNDSKVGELAQAEYWISLACTQPYQLNRKLAQAIEERLKQKNWKELFRLGLLIESFPNALAEFEPPLITYARGMVSFTIGDLEGATEQFSKLPRQERQVEIAGVTLSIPDEVNLISVDLSFIEELLQFVSDNYDNPQSIYSFLSQNLGKLNKDLIWLLKRWSSDLLLKIEPERLYEIATDVIKFSSLLEEFSLGNRASNLEIAITGYQIACEVFRQEQFPEQWGIIQNYLGVAYIHRIQGDRAENLESAIHYLQAALEFYSHSIFAFPEQLALTQNNLGVAYTQRIRGEKAENLEFAIRCFNDALQVRTREAFPKQWAMTQKNLGMGYSDRIRGEKAQNVEMAIDCFQAALEVNTLQNYPQEWADIQNNLAVAYAERLRGDVAENLELAISCFQNALQIYTRETFPYNWAMTQNNLALAYRKRIRGEETENLERAINCCQNALLVCSREAFPMDWANTQLNLGNAYRDRIRGNRSENLEKAISCFQAALIVYTREAFPQQWAETQKDMGIVYRDRIRGEKSENLEQAISCFQAALTIYTREYFPQQWAETQKDMGIVYRDRIRGEKSENLGQAISCFQAALQVYTRESFPHNYLEFLFNLGSAYQEAQDFPNAYNAFVDSIDTVESFHRGDILFNLEMEKGKEHLAKQWTDLYQNIIEVCLALGYSDRALEYVERSKARSLVELFVNIDIYPKSNIPDSIINELKRLRQQIALEQKRFNSQVENYFIDDYFIFNNDNLVSDFQPIQPNQNRLNQLRQQLDNLIKRDILPLDPDFELTQRVKTISFSEIQSLIDERTAIIEWYITDKKFYTFIITKQSNHPSVLQFSDRLELSNWANQYLQNYQEAPKLWREQLSQQLHNISQKLHIDQILHHLPQTCESLILIPHSFLHWIPLHAVPLSRGLYLLDRFSGGVSYTLSCQFLQILQNRHRPSFSNLLAIQNPNSNLAYTDMEVKTIEKYFLTSNILAKEEVKKSSINEEINYLSVHGLHFAGSSNFNIDSPLESELMLSGEVLTLQEIFNLDLSQCRLVTLSACETGLTDWKNEFIGFPSAFLLTGSKNVVGSLWAPDDLSTAFLMIQFYKNLQQDLAVALALNQAQLWLKNLTKRKLERWIEENQLLLEPTIKMGLRRRLYKMADNEQPFSEPFHWAAFCAIGV